MRVSREIRKIHVFVRDAHTIMSFDMAHREPRTVQCAAVRRMFSTDEAGASTPSFKPLLPRRAERQRPYRVADGSASPPRRHPEPGAVLAGFVGGLDPRALEADLEPAAARTLQAPAEPEAEQMDAHGTVALPA